MPFVLERIIITSIFQPDEIEWNLSSVDDLRSIPNVGVSRVPNVDVPRVPNVGVPRVPSVGVPRVPTMNVPRVPNVGVPRVFTVDVPRVPVLDVPRVPSVGVPRVPNWSWLKKETQNKLINNTAPLQRIVQPPPRNYD